MGVTISTHPTSVVLVDRAEVRRELRLDDAAEPILSEVVQHVSSLIEDHCCRSFARAQIVETLPGYGGPLLMLSRTPVVLVSSVLHEGSAILDYVVENPDTGMLYRQLGWAWTRELGWYLGPNLVGRSEHPKFSVTYIAGYLVPDDDVASAALSVSSVDNSFNLSAGSFPLLVAGDRITASGFTDSANNGTHTVVSRTDTKVVVGSALVTEAENADVKLLRVRTLPGSIQRAAIDEAKAKYIARHRDPGVASRSITGLSVTYAGAQAETNALTPLTVATLSRWRRLA